MHQLTLNISDNAYIDLKKIIENNPSIEIEKDTYKQSSNEFQINVDNALKTLEQIKSGDTKDFKEVKPKELFEELGFNRELGAREFVLC